MSDEENFTPPTMKDLDAEAINKEAYYRLNRLVDRLEMMFFDVPEADFCPLEQLEDVTDVHKDQAI